jgi:hypothetical protein
MHRLQSGHIAVEDHLTLISAKMKGLYQGAAIAICASCSFRRPGSSWSSLGQSSGNAMGSILD